MNSDICDVMAPKHNYSIPDQNTITKTQVKKLALQSQFYQWCKANTTAALTELDDDASEAKYLISLKNGPK